MKNFFIAILLCAFACKNVNALVKTSHKTLHTTATSVLTPRNLCIAAGLTAGGWYVSKLYQRHLEKKRLKEEELRLCMVQAKFFEAWGAGNVAEIEQSMRAGASLRICNTDGQTPLMVAIIQNDIEMVKLFLHYDPESCLLCDNYIKYAYDYAEVSDSKEIKTALQDAATEILCTIVSTGKEVGIVSVTQAVGAGADVNGKRDGTPFLISAVINENINLIEKLIAAGADTEERDAFGYTINDLLTVLDNREPMQKAIAQALADRERWKKTVEAEAFLENCTIQLYVENDFEAVQKLIKEGALLLDAQTSTKADKVELLKRQSGESNSFSTFVLKNAGTIYGIMHLNDRLSTRVDYLEFLALSALPFHDEELRQNICLNMLEYTIKVFNKPNNNKWHVSFEISKESQDLIKAIHTHFSSCTFEECPGQPGLLLGVLTKVKE